MRLRLAALAVCLLAASAGCAGLVGDGLSPGRLDANPPTPYDWNTSRDVTVTVYGNGTYQSVYDLSNTTRLELYEPSIGNDQPLDVRALQYRYPNGTVLNGSDLRVTTEGNRRVVEVPNASGSLAYTARGSIKEFGSPAFVEGSYEVILPPDHRVGSILFGDVDPPRYTTSVDEQGRLHVIWDEVSRDVYVRYFLKRDVALFWGLVGILSVVGLFGMAYYYRQIRKLERQREELGLNVDTDPDDEFDDGGPPLP